MKTGPAQARGATISFGQTRAITRRQLLGRLAASLPLVAGAVSLFGVETASWKRFGVGAYSYSLHWKAARDAAGNGRFKDSLGFLDYCHGLGAAGVQVAVGSKEPAYAAKIRARAEALGMYFEGEAIFPKTESDLERFEADVRAAKEAGAEIVRTAMLGGRRYEALQAAGAFREFAEKSWQSLTRAEGVLKKHRIRLAIENHKDWRVAELVDILRRLSSEWVGVCVDTGNSLALMEEPMAIVTALAPFALSAHIKDMAVKEYEDGFLLSEVPFGEGFLDLNAMVSELLRANPRLHFNLEMITRDPLKIPCLTPAYFATMPSVSGRELAAVVAQVRRFASQKPLPRTTGLSAAEQLALEDGNVRQCFAYARRKLPGLL